MQRQIKDIDRLSDIEEFAHFILKYTKDLKETHFYEDEVLRLALLKVLENFGEAARQLSTQTRQEFDELDWQAMILARHVYVHEYFNIEWPVIWNTLKTVDFVRIATVTREITTILRNRYSL